MILNKFGNIVLEYWHSLTGRYTNIELDKFVVMPNHLHGFLKLSIGRSMNHPYNQIKQWKDAGCSFPKLLDISK